jgi:hypothetical protein
MARGSNSKNDTIGDGGAAEAEHQTAIDRMENLATDYELEGGAALVASTTAFLLDQIKSRPKPFSACSQGEQRDVFAACEHAATELVRKIVEEVAANGKEPVRALLESYSEKDGVKATIKIKAATEEEEESAILTLHRGRGKIILFTVATVEDYNSKPAEDPSEPDQQALGFEAGNDEVPLDEGEEVAA